MDGRWVVIVDEGATGVSPDRRGGDVVLGPDGIAVVVLGVVVLLVTFWDVVSTTIGVSGGAGPVTSRTSRWLWTGLSALGGGESRRVRQAAGPLVLVSVILTWVAGVLAGWAMVIAPHGWVGPGGQPVAATPLQVLRYVVGAVLGQTSPEVFPATTTGTVGEVLAALTGAVSVGLVVAYVLPVVSAVVDGRQLSAYIATLGHTPAAILERNWDGEGFADLDLHLIALTPQITGQAEKHLAYPVLFYFHSLERHTSLQASIVVLDETITLVDCCTSSRVQDSALLPARIALSEFLDTLRHGHIRAFDEDPPVPDPEGDTELGALPLLGGDDLTPIYDDISMRRRLLSALLHHAGWDWDDVTHGEVADRELDPLGLRPDRP